jgi:hypothetical protein
MQESTREGAHFILRFLRYVIRIGCQPGWTGEGIQSGTTLPKLFCSTSATRNRSSADSDVVPAAALRQIALCLKLHGQILVLHMFGSEQLNESGALAIVFACQNKTSSPPTMNVPTIQRGSKTVQIPLFKTGVFRQLSKTLPPAQSRLTEFLPDRMCQKRSAGETTPNQR